MKREEEAARLRQEAERKRKEDEEKRVAEAKVKEEMQKCLKATNAGLCSFTETSAPFLSLI